MQLHRFPFQSFSASPAEQRQNSLASLSSRVRTSRVRSIPNTP